jgi:hypothetical protein
MKSHWLAGYCVAALSLAGVPLRAQSVISAKSGLVHYAEGAVFLGDQKVDPKFGQFPEVKEKAVLRTEEGRAEVLLNPGVFLRLGENSSFRMITNRLIDTRVDLLTGAAVVEADEIGKDTGVTIVCKEAGVTLRKTGVYRFDQDPARLRVYSGDALVQLNGQNIEVVGGKMLAFEGDDAALVSKFDKEDTDSLTRWSRRRGEYMAMANVSAAKSLRDSGSSLYSSVWQWNPYFGMMTFIPARGTLYSPYGFQFWSPMSVHRVFYTPPPASYAGGGFGASNMGYASVPRSAGGYSGTMAAAGSAAPAAAAHSGSTAAPAAGVSSIGHGSGGGGGRGGR